LTSLVYAHLNSSDTTADNTLPESSHLLGKPLSS
jgi:hypothetical protein